MLVTSEHRPQTDSTSEGDVLKATRPNELLDGISQKIVTGEHTNRSRSALASAPEEYDTPKVTPTPSTRKRGTAVKRQDLVSFEDMGEFISSMHFFFADPYNFNCRH